MSIEEQVRQVLEGLPEFLPEKQPKVVVQLTMTDADSGEPVAMLFMVAHSPIVAMRALEETAKMIERGAENNWRA